MLCSSETSEAATVACAFGPEGAPFVGKEPRECEYQNLGTNSVAKGCRAHQSSSFKEACYFCVLSAAGGSWKQVPSLA